jgi:hypothetical protein
MANLSTIVTKGAFFSPLAVSTILQITNPQHFTPIILAGCRTSNFSLRASVDLLIQGLHETLEFIDGPVQFRVLRAG